MDKIVGAPFGRKDAMDAPNAGICTTKPVCEICGAAAERKRRRDGSWFYYTRCRACRRLPKDPGFFRNEATDQRLSTLLFALYYHLITLKQAGWPNSSKAQVLKGLKVLLAFLQEE
jgi:hypothetical protein